jgi:hypothetical protein
MKPFLEEINAFYKHIHILRFSPKNGHTPLEKTAKIHPTYPKMHKHEGSIGRLCRSLMVREASASPPEGDKTWEYR